MASGGDYESSLILRPGIWEELRRRSGFDPVFAAPNRGIFLVPAGSSAEAVAVLKAIARRGFETGSYPGSRKIFRRYDRKLTVLEDRARMRAGFAVTAVSSAAPDPRSRPPPPSSAACGRHEGSGGGSKGGEA